MAEVCYGVEVVQETDDPEFPGTGGSTSLYLGLAGAGLALIAFQGN